MRGMFDARIAGVSFGGTVAALALAAAPGFAAQAHPVKIIGGAAHGTRQAPAVAPLVNRIPQSATVGGYIVSPSEGITTVSSTFKLPKTVTCTDSGSTTLFLGEDVLAGGGGDAAWAQVVLGCGYNGLMTTGAPGGETENANANLGDTIETRIAQTPGGATIATVDDLTNGQAISTQGTIDSSGSQVILGAERSAGGDGSIEKFSKVMFTGVQVGGLDWNQTNPAPNPYALDMTDYGPQIVPSPIPTKPSSTFTLTEKKTS
jgi:hypothetical protein